MKKLLPLFLLSLVLLSCGNKKEDPKPVYVHKEGVVRVEVSASNLSKDAMLYSKITITGKGTNTYSSGFASKSPSKSHETAYVDDNGKVGVTAWLSDPSLCSTPIIIKIYFDGVLLTEETKTDACSSPNKDVGTGAALPGYGK